MIIKKVAFGNQTEAFIEDRFKEGTNIIFSNENNRGKTLVMQSLAYSIGYDSIFPTGFNIKKYYFYIEIEIEKRKFEFVRKGNSLLVLNQDQLYVFNTITEFRYYFNQEIFTLPKIDKEGQQKIVDLGLFYEIFFLGQDKRNTSNLIVKGQNNKVDFMNMIYSMLGIEIWSENKYDIESLKKEKSKLESKIKAESRKISVIKKNPEIASFISAAANNIEYQNVASQLKEFHLSIGDLKKSRNREENRKNKLEALLSELNSLNRNLNEGKVKCADCGSSKVVFTNDDFVFEISNNYVRQNILSSIKSNIELKREIIGELNSSILREQEQITKLLETNVPEVKNYILFEDEIVDSKDIDKIVKDLQKQVEEIENQLRNNEIKTISNKDKQKDILSNILIEMKRLYNLIDPEGLLGFEDVFTKAGETYSGSEGQEYYFCKMVALRNILDHSFPIIIDSFREGELSSNKETIMLEEFKNLNQQVILTSTLKNEEYIAEKYYSIEGLNVLDYSTINDSRILDEKYTSEFLRLLASFNILL